MASLNATVASSEAHSCIKEYTDTYDQSNWFSNIAPWTYLTVSTVGIALNGAVIWLLCLNRVHMSRNPRLLVTNQSVIDLVLNCLAGVKWATVHLPNEVPDSLLGSLVCHIWYSQSAMWVFINASTFNLQLITIERYLAIVRPLIRRQLWKVKLACALMWLLGAAHQWKIFMDVGRGGPDGTCCVITGFVSPSLALTYGLANYSLKFALPLANMCFCYGRMILVLRRQSRFCLPTDAQSKKLAASRVLIKTFMIAGVAYILCFVTNQTNYILISFSVIANNYQSFFYNITLFLVNVNALVNPIIYAIFMPRLRTAAMAELRQICRIRQQQQRVASGSYRVSQGPNEQLEQQQQQQKYSLRRLQGSERRSELGRLYTVEESSTNGSSVTAL